MEQSKWACDQNSFERHHAHGFTWLQRSYRCSFCRKEFKSAQALGGHMNIHRRDKARMRLSSPSSWDVPNPNHNAKPSNPNPGFPLPAFGSKFLWKNVLDVECGDLKRKVNRSALMSTKLMTNFAVRRDVRVWMANEFVNPDWGLGLVGDVEEDLDLELRLGCS